ncbi:hypothetical protein KM043_011525 [Ampulex compressa]|nr:hypothetical protein KM043_011525 [Ampulex compressa]
MTRPEGPTRSGIHIIQSTVALQRDDHLQTPCIPPSSFASVLRHGEDGKRRVEKLSQLPQRGKKRASPARFQLS